MCEAPCVRDASVAYAKISSSRIVSSLRISEKTARAWRTAFITLPVPALPLRRIIAAPSAMRRSASPRSCEGKGKGRGASEGGEGGGGRGRAEGGGRAAIVTWAPQTNGMLNGRLSMWWVSSAAVRTSDSSMQSTSSASSTFDS